MKIGIHKVHNRFPYILRYIIPKRLTLKCRSYSLYKWMWFYIYFDKDNKLLKRDLYPDWKKINKQHNKLLEESIKKYADIWKKLADNVTKNSKEFIKKKKIFKG